MIPEAFKKNPPLLWARRLTWLYFFLLIFEGALGKWVFPGYANGWLLARDFVVLGIYTLLLLKHQFPSNGFLRTSLWLAVLLGALALFWGHGNFLITLYGLRTNFLHLPLIFIIGELFSLDDVWRFGRALLWICLPMAGLLAGQFLSPLDAPINTTFGAAGPNGLKTAASALIADFGAFGNIHALGTFSSPAGLTCFFALAGAFIATSFLEKRGRWLAGISLAALVLALVCSTRWAGIAAGVIVFAGALWAVFLNPKRIHEALIFAVVAVGLIVAVSFNPVFQEAAGVMRRSFGNVAADSAPLPSSAAPMTDSSLREVSPEELQKAQLEGRKISRLARNFFFDFSEPWQVVKKVSLAGAGTGAGTMMAGWLLTGEAKPLLSENEWARLLLESGLILGLFVIGLRVALCGYLLYWAWRCLKKADNFLPWILCFAVVPWVFCGLWGQPTLLGFACFGAGLVLAATRPSYSEHPLFKYAYSAMKTVRK